MISIVIPLYNKEKQIVTTLRSVFSQTFQDFEIIVVNDGSTDDSLAELKKMSDSRIRIVNQKNGGVSAARNRGIDEARWNLIAFLDADDEWKPEYLQTQYELFLKYPECSVFACNYEFQNSCGEITPTTIRRLPFNEQDGILTNYFEVGSYSHPPIWTSAIMVKKEAIQKIGGFPVGIASGEDLLTWAKLAICTRIAYSKNVASIYHFDMASFNKNPRIPDDNDFVEKELNTLYQNNKNILCLKNYISYWNQIKSSILMRFPQRKKILIQIIKSLKANPLSAKSWFFLFFAFLPLKLRLSLLKK